MNDRERLKSRSHPDRYVLTADQLDRGLWPAFPRSEPIWSPPPANRRPHPLDHLRLGTSSALLSSESFGSKIERTAKRHPLWPERSGLPSSGVVSRPGALYSRRVALESFGGRHGGRLLPRACPRPLIEALIRMAEQLVPSGGSCRGVVEAA